MDLFNATVSSPETWLFGTKHHIYRIINSVEGHTIVNLSCYRHECYASKVVHVFCVLVVHCQGGWCPFGTRLQIKSIRFWTSWPLHLKVSARSASDLPSLHCLSAVLNSSSVNSSIGTSKLLSAGGIDVTSLESVLLVSFRRTQKYPAHSFRFSSAAIPDCCYIVTFFSATQFVNYGIKFSMVIHLSK